MTWWTGLLIAFGTLGVPFAVVVTFMYGFVPDSRFMRWLGEHPLKPTTPGYPEPHDYVLNVIVLVFFWWWAVPAFRVVCWVGVAFFYVIVSPVLLPYNLGRWLRARRAAKLPRAKVIP
jgi:hypothetical protein